MTVPTVLIVAAGHPLARRRRIRLADLDRERVILPPADRPHHARVLVALGEAGVRVEVAVEAAGWELMAHYASLGLGVAPVNGICLVPKGACAVEVDGLPRITYHALLPRGRPIAPDVRALHRYLAEALRRKWGG